MAWAQSKKDASLHPMGTGGMTNKQRQKNEEKLDKRQERHEKREDRRDKRSNNEREKDDIKNGVFDGTKKVRTWGR